MAQTPDEPLTLTVHSLPRLDQASADAAASTRAGRWKMLGLMLVCAAPVIASYFTYYVVRPEGRRNYGELIDPQRPLPAWTGTNAQGRAVPLSTLKDHLYVVDPLGNWMMRFPANLDPKQAKRDLDRLLRASAFWDKEGRTQ